MRDYSINIHPESLKPKPKKIQLQNPKNKKLIYLLPLVFLVFISIFFLSKINLRFVAGKVISPNAIFERGNDDLLTGIKKLTDNKQGTFSVYIYDLNKANGIGIDETTVFTAASVNKIAILAALYDLASNGKVDLEKIVILQQEDIQDYGSGSIRYDPPGTPFMICAVVSNQSFEPNQSFSDSEFERIRGALTHCISVTRADSSDTGNEGGYAKMFDGEVANKTLTPEMLGFMDKSDFDDRIPRYLPKDIKVYHKTGDEVGKIHDVGIVALPSHPYYLGIFTSDMTDEAGTKETLAKISKIVFDYYK
ncbi:MAG: Beta-lactamase class A-like protein [Candidatus Gottesmanbacteria bacterium GW2011_GWC2_39_8]|uniref:Beta-lactamase class A-like protein n=1 Tax=Candidatus Gottesmanbacteria bacterium GW2011_GWC2_39_8 TaxID=1618450 RepID=A0A0G0PSI1_9BACT|nr:MAG: Beta-lactamase class A-like protein [Candidatus Gottesmanbacteria bacterium GW2011_GWC2_39_8]